MPEEGRLADLRFALEDEFGPIDEVRQEANIGPIISGELTWQALILFIVGSAGILSWMTFRFADFRMGVSAVVALVHDIIVVVGVFAILGTFFHLEIDALFVTAMLTVIGFSVHDTIVVFDRVRENRIRHAGEPFSEIVNHSLLQTIGRSLNTSLTRRETGQLIVTICAQLVALMGAIWGVHLVASALKVASVGWSTVLTAGAQGALAWYATLVVGRAAERYLVAGKSWGESGPKRVVQDIVAQLDRDSILREAREEILARLRSSSA